MAHEFINQKFIEAMNEIGELGCKKHNATCFHCTGKGLGRDTERKRAFQIAEHADEHFDAYLRGIPHDHFNTRRHQLAAVAYNAMMEFILAGLEHDPWEM